jgi:signal transduction histidine kinase
MRSLFLKIFLAFWLTAVLIGIAPFIIWNLQPDRVVNRWRASMGEAISLYSLTAAEEWDRYGEQELVTYLQRLNVGAHIRATLFDENGHVIAGQSPPVAAQLFQRAMESDQPEFILHLNTAYVGEKVVGPSGRTYVFVAGLPRGPFGAFIRNARGEMIRWSVSILVSGLICYLLTRYLTRPILRMSNASRQLASGNLTARASPELERRRDELGELVHDFNQMAERIESLVNSQRQLISDISHELRSPLARLNVALGLARQRAGADAAGPLDRIEREAERLNEMIGKLLALARMEATTASPEGATLDVRDLITEIAEDAEFEAQECGCSVRFRTEPEGKSCLVNGNAELLRSALENVVRNAVRYTAPGTEVEIVLACTENEAVVSVRDHGPGVPEFELPNLFRPFYRVANARDRQSGGAGLGLAITERAVRLHGGSVRAINASGGGLIIEICLPAVPAPVTRETMAAG